MKTRYITYLALPLMLASAWSCTDLAEDAVEVVSGGSTVKEIVLQLPELKQANTRTEFTVDEVNHTLKTAWKEGDVAGIFPTTGYNQVEFPISDAWGESVARFDGGDWALRANKSYAAYFPFNKANFERDASSIILSYEGQEQTENGSVSHLSDYDYLATGAAQSDQNGSIYFQMQRLSGIVRFALTLPEDETAAFTKLTLKADEEVFDVEKTLNITGENPELDPAKSVKSISMKLDNIYADENHQLIVFMTLPPMNVEGQIELNLKKDDGMLLVATTDGFTVEAGKVQGYAFSDFELTQSLLTNANLIAAAEASTGMTFTKNTDGSVSLSNNDNYQIAMAVTNLDLRGKSDPLICEEIGMFSNLEFLDCCYNGIIDLDLTDNTALTELWCSDNQLINLDLSNNTALTTLLCPDNLLTNLDLTKNTALTALNCNNNQLTKIDLSDCTALTDLCCNDNQLTNLNLSNNTALTVLWCSNNQLTSLNLSNNTALTNLQCKDNQLNSLDLTENTALTDLWCSDNQLTNLDLSDCTALTTLWCDNNQLTSLDLTENTALTGLLCYRNQLTNLDLSNNTALTSLDCATNQLTNLDLSNNTALTSLDCGANQLTSLDLTNNIALTLLLCNVNKLTSLDLSNNTALTTLWCNDNQLTSLDLSNNTALTTLSCFLNQLTSLDISNNNQIDWLNLYVGFQTDSSYYIQELNLYVNANQYTQTLRDSEKNRDVNVLLKSDLLLTNAYLIAAAEASTGMQFVKNADGTVTLDEVNMAIVEAIISLDLSDKNDPTICDEIEYFENLDELSCSGNQLTSLDLSNNLALRYLDCQGSKLTSLDLSNNLGLRYLECSYNQLTSLDLSNNPSLCYLSCTGNQLTGLDLSNNPALEELGCNYNQLTNLDLSNNSALIILDCYNNQLTNLNLSNNPALEILRCNNNKLASLDLSNNTSLNELVCCFNYLRNLDVSNNLELSSLDCGNNGITSLNVSNNTALTSLLCNDMEPSFQLTDLDVSNNIALKELICWGNKLISLDVSHNTALNKLCCQSNQLSSLNVSNNTELTDLQCSSNHLSSLDVSNNPALTYLECYFNQLSSLDISNNNQLHLDRVLVGAQKDILGDFMDLTLYVNDTQYTETLMEMFEYNTHVIREKK